MQAGEVVGIYLHGPKAEALRSVQEANAVPGCGLEGDRMFRRQAGRLQPDQELTLIEAEAIEAVKRETGIALLPGQPRRQLVIRNIRLNELVDREFQIGEVRVHGQRLCQPCDHLESLTQPGVKAAYHHRGGLRARILTSGTIRVGDAVVS